MKRRKLCAECSKSFEDTSTNNIKIYCPIHGTGPAQNRRARHRFKQLIFVLLGGPKCKRCGFSDQRALQIDHVYGGGTKQRAKFSNNWVYRFILKNPKLFQILCANCNWIKRFENGEANATNT